MKPIRYTLHGRESLEENPVDEAWVERAVREPDWVQPDRQPPKQRRYRVIPEFGNRVLRVVCVEEPDHIRVVTVFFDRNARRPDDREYDL